MTSCVTGERVYASGARAFEGGDLLAFLRAGCACICIRRVNEVRVRGFLRPAAAGN